MPSPYKSKMLGKPEKSPKLRTVSPHTPAVCPSVKTLHESEAEAGRAARAKMAEGAPELWSYECNQCGAWHLTSQAPKARFRIRKG